MYQKHLDTLIAAWNTGDVNLLDNIAAPNVKRIAPTAISPAANSLSEFKTVITDLRKAFPDLKVTLSETFFSENRSACRWNAKGKNTGPGVFPATGRSIDIDGASVAQYENNKLVREEVYFDALTMLTQLGVIQSPKSATA
jgi:hypothetical protein